MAAEPAIKASPARITRCIMEPPPGARPAPAPIISERSGSTRSLHDAGGAGASFRCQEFHQRVNGDKFLVPERRARRIRSAYRADDADPGRACRTQYCGAVID